MKKHSASFRSEPLEVVAGLKVTAVEDYLSSKRMEKGGIESNINLPKSNVIKYFFEDGTWIALRPSGTEPKVKFYFGVTGSSLQESKEKLTKVESQFMAIVNKKIADLS